MPVLEQTSGLKAGSDFTVGYSPERINPGDKEHRFETIIKVVVGAGCAHARHRRRCLRLGGHGRHPSRAVDQGRGSRQGDREHAARPQHRLHERAVRDLPVSSASTPATCWPRRATKWNFLKFYPGLVGGHCIGVDPYYLTHRAEKAGYHPEVILAGRRINDDVGQRVARECVRGLFRRNRRRQRDRHRARPDVQGKRAGHPQFEGRRYRARAANVRASTVQVARSARASPTRRSTNTACRSPRSRRLQARRCRHPRGRA